MPVTPPITVTFENDHKSLAESELHFPKGFTIAENDTEVYKDVHGELIWGFRYYQDPVIGFTSVGSTSFNNGDRYIVSVGSTGSYGGALTNSIASYLTIDSYGQSYNAWDSVVPQAGTLTYVASEGTFYYFDGASWLPLGASGTGESDATVTFTGSNDGTYIDLYTPITGKRVRQIYTVTEDTLEDLGATIKVVLYNGVTEIDLTNEISVAEFNGTVLYDLGSAGALCPAGYDIKLYISGGDIGFGELRVVTYFLP